MSGTTSPTATSRTLPSRPWLLGLGLLVIVLTWGISWSWQQPLEGIALDQRFRLRRHLRAPRGPAPLIVGITDSSFTLAERAPELVAADPALARLQAGWPWDRSMFGDTVRRLRAAGAKLIVFDIVFAGPNPGDADFAAALAEPGAPVVLASLWQVEHRATGEAVAVLREPSAPLLAAGARHGFANVWADPDGVLRHSETQLDDASLLGLAPDPSAAVPSLALAAAQTLAAESRATSPLIDYRFAAADIPVVPIEDLFLPDRWQGDWLADGEFFRDRIVWIGPLSEIQFKDVHLTPLGRMPGVMAQAQAADSYLNDRAPRSFPPVLGAVLVLLLAAAGLGHTARPRRASRQGLLAIGGGALWLVLALAAFVLADLVVPLVAPGAAWLSGCALGIGAQLVSEQRERRRLRSMLGRYVSEEVAQLIADRPDNFAQSLRGERRAVTVLFADLRGFTSWVEDADPEAFVGQLNTYFTAMVDCVLAHGGTLQKYIGDAILAVWGDTRTEGPTEDSARAVAAALAMQAALQGLNTQWATEPGRAQLRIAIGVHHGTVMVGNVGHPRRMEFTVMGDAVNTASRLETANRPLDTEVLVSAQIATLLEGRVRFLPVGPATLKGKRTPLDLFIPLHPVAAEASTWWADAARAQQAWSERDTPTANAIWSRLAAQDVPLRAYFHRRSQLDAPTLDLTAK